MIRIISIIIIWNNVIKNVNHNNLNRRNLYLLLTNNNANYKNLQINLFKNINKYYNQHSNYKYKSKFKLNK